MMDDSPAPDAPDRLSWSFTAPEAGFYRFEPGKVTRVLQETVPDAAWTVIEWDSEDLP